MTAGLFLSLPSCSNKGPPRDQEPTPPAGGGHSSANGAPGHLDSHEISKLAAQGESGAGRLANLTKDSRAWVRIAAIRALLSMAGSPDPDDKNRLAARAVLMSMPESQICRCLNDTLPIQRETWELLLEARPDLCLPTARVLAASGIAAHHHDLNPRRMDVALVQAVPSGRFAAWLDEVWRSTQDKPARRHEIVAAGLVFLRSGDKRKAEEIERRFKWIPIAEVTAALRRPHASHRFRGAVELTGRWPEAAAPLLEARLAEGKQGKPLPSTVVSSLVSSGVLEHAPIKLLEDALLSDQYDVAGLATGVLMRPHLVPVLAGGQMVKRQPNRCSELNAARLAEAIKRDDWSINLRSSPIGESVRATLAVHAGDLWKQMPAEMVDHFARLTGQEKQTTEAVLRVYLGVLALKQMGQIERNRVKPELLAAAWQHAGSHAAMLLLLDGDAKRDLELLYEEYRKARPGPHHLGIFARIFFAGMSFGMSQVAPEMRVMPSRESKYWKQYRIPRFLDVTNRMQAHKNPFVRGVAGQMKSAAEKVQARPAGK